MKRHEYEIDGNTSISSKKITCSLIHAIFYLSTEDNSIRYSFLTVKSTFKFAQICNLRTRSFNKKWEFLVLK